MRWASSAASPASPASKAATAGGTLALTPAALTLKPMLSPAPIGSTVSRPPRGIVCPAISSKLSSSLTRFLASSARGRFQASLVLSSSRNPRADGLGVAEVDLGAGGAGRAEGDAAELQLGGGGAGALLDQIEGESLGLLVLFFRQHFQPVDDGADRADQVMANARAQQGGKIERFDGRSGHGLVSAGRAGCQKTGESLDAPVSVGDTPHRCDRQGLANRTLQDVTGEITPQQAERHLDALTEIVSRAAAATLATPFSSVERRIKNDLSPVTAADEASEAVIVEGVSRLLPGIPVIAEESVGRAAAASLEPSFVIVDPLDGTKEFLAGRDEFTVNVAIVTHGVPIAGIIAAPAQGLLWRGVVGGKAERLRLRFGAGPADAYDRSVIRTRPAPDRLIVATSRSHLDEATEDFLARLPWPSAFFAARR